MGGKWASSQRDTDPPQARIGLPADTLWTPKLPKNPRQDRPLVEIVRTCGERRRQSSGDLGVRHRRHAKGSQSFAESGKVVV